MADGVEVVAERAGGTNGTSATERVYGVMGVASRRPE